MSKSHYEDQEPARSKRILIVEDDPLLGDLLLEALQEEGVYGVNPSDQTAHQVQNMVNCSKEHTKGEN